MEKKLQSVINSIGEQSALLLIAVRDCIVNKKSQAEIATKYNIPRSRVQWAMSGKKEHKKGGKQYQQERKRKTSEEDSTRSLKSVMNYQMSSYREPATITFGLFQDHPILPLGISLKKLLIITIIMTQN